MSEQPTSSLARLFRGATRIEPDEARAALLSFSFLFLLMLAYNMLKPVRDALAPEWSDVELPREMRPSTLRKKRCWAGSRRCWG